MGFFGYYMHIKYNLIYENSLFAINNNFIKLFFSGVEHRKNKKQNIGRKINN